MLKIFKPHILKVLCVVCLCILAIFSINVVKNTTQSQAAGVLAEVYLLGTGASDSNDGVTSSTPVATFEKAKELLAEGGTIYLGGQLDIGTGTTVMSLENPNGEPGTLMRLAGFTGIMINIPAGTSASPNTLTLENIVIDGNRNCNGTDTCSGNSIIQVGNYDILNINSGSKLQNNRKTTTHGGAIFANATRVVININGGIIENNTATGGNYYAGGIYILNSTLNFNSGAIRGNNAQGAGGGIFAQGTTANPANVTFGDGAYLENNTSGANGGGLYIGNGYAANLTFNGGTIQSNQATQGGGFYANIPAAGSVTFNNATISNNTATTNGGGIYLTGLVTTNIRRAVIRGNQANTSGGGIFATGGTTVNIGDSANANQNNSDVIIDNNLAKAYGGGMYDNSNATINLWSGTISNNESQGVGGGGLNTSTNGKTNIYGGFWSGNSATGSTGRGGAIYNSSQEGTTTKILGGTIDSTNTSRTGTSNGVYYSAIDTDLAVLEIGDAEILSNVYIGSTANGEVVAKIVSTLSSPILFYVESYSEVYEGRVFAAGSGGYTLAQSDIDNMLIQVPDGAGTWYVKLDEQDRAVLTATRPEIQLDIVFVDGIDGSDNYAGNTPTAAVKTFAEARRRLIRDGIIYIVNTVTVSGTVSWELPTAAYGTASIRRYAGSHGGSAFTGTMIEITSTGNLSLANINLNGGGITLGPIIDNSGTLNVAGLTRIGVDEFDGGVYLNTGKLITLTSTPESGSRFNIEGVAEVALADRVVGTRAGVTATELIASYFTYLPAGARVIPSGNNYILDSAVTATSQGLTNVVTGVAFDNAKIIFTLLDGEFSDTFNPSDFLTSTLASQIASISTHPTDPVYAGTPVKTSPTTIEIPIYGTPTVVRNTPFVLTLPTTIPMANIDGATSDIPVAGAISIYPIKYAGADVTVPVLTSGSLGQEALAVSSQIDGANPGLQTIQYAISTSDSTEPSALSWVSSGSFTHLEPETTYYVYARTEGNNSYYAGMAQVSVAITTLRVPSGISLSIIDDTVSFSVSISTPENNDSTGMLVTTDNASGYIVDIIADDSDSLTSNDDWLECSTSTDKFVPLTQNGALQNNTWGWGINSTTPSTWNIISATNATEIVSSLTATGPNSDGAGADSYTLWFGAKSSGTLAPCTYGTTVVVSAVARP